MKLKPASRTKVGRIRVLVAEPRRIHALLRRIPRVDVVGEVDQTQKALKLIAARQPHIVLFSAGVTGVDGLRLANRIIKQYPGVKVAMVAPRYSDEYASHVLRAGVSGLLLQSVSLKELTHALGTLADGGIYICKGANIPGVTKQSARRTATSVRQREVLELIAEGKNTKEIAAIMNISPKTVETHRVKLMRRLKIFSVAGLVRYAIRTGLAVMDLE